MNKTTVYLPEKLQQGLLTTAKRLNKTQSDLIREAIDQYIRNVSAPQPLSLGMGSDKKLRAKESKEWLKDQWSMSSK